MHGEWTVGGPHVHVRKWWHKLCFVSFQIQLLDGKLMSIGKFSCRLIDNNDYTVHSVWQQLLFNWRMSVAGGWNVHKPHTMFNIKQEWRIDRLYSNSQSLLDDGATHLLLDSSYGLHRLCYILTFYVQVLRRNGSKATRRAAGVRHKALEMFFYGLTFSLSFSWVARFVSGDDETATLRSVTCIFDSSIVTIS